jgi:hypothetical protein
MSQHSTPRTLLCCEEYMEWLGEDCSTSRAGRRGTVPSGQQQCCCAFGDGHRFKCKVLNVHQNHGVPQEAFRAELDVELTLCLPR